MKQNWFVPVCGSLVMLFCATVANAQTTVPVNPTQIAFEHLDFAGTDLYSVGYFSSETATSPVQEANFAKPASCAPCQGALPSRPSTFQRWYVGVRAIAGALSSAWSAPLVPFDRAPSAPTAVRPLP